MKKTFLSLAVLIFMAAPMMTSCNKDLDEIQAEKVDSNTVTLTIALPASQAETRVTVDGSTLKITGWELNDEVNLYIITMRSSGSRQSFESISDGVTFKCIDAANGTFIGTLPEGKTLEDYNFAVFGATAKRSNNKDVDLVQKTMCSTALKDVVMMAARKSDDGTYTMNVVNNVMKVKNNTGSAMEVAWYGKDYTFAGPYFFTPGVNYTITIDLRKSRVDEKWDASPIDDSNSWSTVSHFTLQSGVDSYINMCIMGHYNEKWGIAKEDGTEVVPMKAVETRGGKMGTLYNAGIIE